MISCVKWIPRGAVQRVPAKQEYSAEERAMIEERAQQEQAEQMENDIDAEGSGAEEQEENAPEGGNNDYEQDAAFDSLKDVELPEGFDMDNYDQETENLGIQDQYLDPEDDPYIDKKGEDQSDNDSEQSEDDYIARASDTFLISASTEDEHSCLEVYCYNEDDASLFVHHDITLPAFPLCVEWLDCAPSLDQPTQDPSKNPVGSYAAVGTFKPGIEIWNLDVMNPLEPTCVLGGVDEEKTAQKLQRRSRKKKASGIKKGPALQQGSHSDAVMSLSWNKPYRNLLASASADKTIKVWDVLTQQAVGTFTHHKDKVQAIQWNPAEHSVIASGSFDKNIAVFDTKASKDKVLWLPLSGEIESLCWSPHNPAILVTSDEDGSVMAYDVRRPDNYLYTIAAHTGACTNVSLSPLVKDLMITSGIDKTVKVWDLQSDTGTPTCIRSKSANIGKVFASSIYSHSPWLVAAGGSKGKLAIWDLESDTNDVVPRFSNTKRVMRPADVPGLAVRSRHDAQATDTSTAASAATGAAASSSS
eukprot:gb/GECG01016248.1/.p1 GENE.gb/GECG01016248.1/~~gb/GECG01016248.1/.p1  ORF type:complete len:530 (+),score=91.95 gb/GECG01016248.1/:1-1590(+)